MSLKFNLKKGFNINLDGIAIEELGLEFKSNSFAIKPTDFLNITRPKLLVDVGDDVKAGTPVVYDKLSENIMYCSPVSGEVIDIIRGDKRRLEEIRILPDKTNKYLNHKKYSEKEIQKLSREDIIDNLTKSGVWPNLIQRPFGLVADTKLEPKSIHISFFDSSPLAPNYSFIYKEELENIDFGLLVLSKLTNGKIHLNHNAESIKYFKNDKYQNNEFSGPHPSGNVGVQIHHIDPINAGETVWVVGAEDVANIGRFFQSGVFDPSRTLAVAGHPLASPCYYKSTIGAALEPLLDDVGAENLANLRVINGDVLTGTATSANGYVGYYNNTVSVLPEGNRYRMFGWLPFAGPNLHSMSNTSLSWLFPKKQYTPDTNLNGEERALVVTGEMERVFPMDIYPMQLLKACMANDIEKMEQLGIYEVAPEDFALIDYANSSKIEAQAIIRDALDLMNKEVG